MCTLMNWSVSLCSTWNVYYWTNWKFIWNSKRLYATKSQNDATNNQILETPTQPQMPGLIFIFINIQSLCLKLFLYFTKIKPLKSYKFFFSPKLLFWFLQYSNFRRKLGTEKQETMASWCGWLELPTLIFRKIQKPMQIKGSKMARWWTTKSGFKSSSWHF